MQSEGCELVVQVLSLVESLFYDYSWLEELGNWDWSLFIGLSLNHVMLRLVHIIHIYSNMSSIYWLFVHLY